MTHHIYHTDAIILESKHSRDANKFFTLFTEEVGLLRATAQGVRRIDSKLRYALQEFSVVRADLIKGREVWRITSATPVRQLLPSNKNIFFEELVEDNADRKIAIARVAKLAATLLPPEVPHPELFATIFSFFQSMADTSFSKEVVEQKEITVVVEMLVALGYLPESAKHLSRKEAVVVINQSLRDTQLL